LVTLEKSALNTQCARKKKRLTLGSVSRGLWGSDPGFHGCGGSEMRGQIKIRRATSNLFQTQTSISASQSFKASSTRLMLEEEQSPCLEHPAKGILRWEAMSRVF
jgi:hypothetical protein